MTFSSNKSTTLATEIWTTKHDDYCIANSITPSAQYLWRWLIKEGKIGEEIEPDLIEFNEHIKSIKGKGYCRLTLKTALAQLIEHRIIQLIKQYTWRIVKCITRPLEWLQPKRNLPKRNKTFTLHPLNSENSEGDVKQQQQDYLKEQNQDVLAKSGIYIDIKCNAILLYSTLEIKLAIIMFYLKGGFQKIDQNPEGWIRQCLTSEYWQETSNYQRIIKYIFRHSPQIPNVDFEDIEDLIDKTWRELTGNINTVDDT